MNYQLYKKVVKEQNVIIVYLIYLMLRKAVFMQTGLEMIVRQ